MRKVAIVLLLSGVLVGCSSEPKVVPVSQKFNPTEVLAKPPAEAMIEPVEPTPLPYGASNADNSEIVKNNNLNAANDRGKLRILQQYVRNIFNPQK
ncbi:hypothetical protein SP19_7 [Salmonella phage 19]|nr:hypothetical protein SP41_5 [Salmonella phage 41]AKJ74498.1 hypothetical protein SP19_7 [Salmonella phage 19]